MKDRLLSTLSLSLASVLLASLNWPGGAAHAETANADTDLHALIERYGLSGDPAQGLTIPAIESPAAQLGKRLFFSRSLSGNLDVACASCHHPLLGGSDSLSLPLGPGVTVPEQLGVTRRLWGDAAPNEARNAPTTFNVALWQRYLFHDGRIGQLVGGKDKTPSDVYSSNAALNKTVGITTPDVPFPRPDHWAGQNLVQAQARFPLVSVEEMRGEDFNSTANNGTYRSKLAARLGGYGPLAHLLPHTVTQFWVDEFRKVFKAPDAPASTLVTEQNISYLLSEYERSQLFVANPWNRYVQGDATAISPAAKQGALLFFRPPGEGGFGCTACHQGAFFTDEHFHNMLIPPIGPGKQPESLMRAGNDKGRFLVTGEDSDLYRFRTPTLLNVEVSGPWGHNGAYTTLEGMVEHMLSPRRQALAYDSGQLQQHNIQTRNIPQQLAEVLAHEEHLPEQAYTPADVQQLVAFLKTLTDPCVKDASCLQAWLPEDEQPDLLVFKLEDSGR